jgi:hypothetical protein
MERRLRVLCLEGRLLRQRQPIRVAIDPVDVFGHAHQGVQDKEFDRGVSVPQLLQRFHPGWTAVSISVVSLHAHSFNWLHGFGIGSYMQKCTPKQNAEVRFALQSLVSLPLPLPCLPLKSLHAASCMNMFPAGSPLVASWRARS